VKPIALLTVAVLLMTLMAPLPAEALKPETAGWLAYIGAAIIVQVFLIVTRRAPGGPTYGASDLTGCGDSEDDASGCLEDVAASQSP